jgi:regulator of protease activity HflC (stomatin/prohibitin superfamily)
MMNEKVSVQKTLEDSVRIAFKRLGFTLENFVTGITPPKSILETNQAKNNALQSVYKAKADVENANAQALVKVATARADAEAMLVTARAEAEAVRLKTVVLTPMMIQKMWIDKWDGALPYLQAGQGGTMLNVQMPK